MDDDYHNQRKASIPIKEIKFICNIVTKYKGIEKSELIIKENYNRAIGLLNYFKQRTINKTNRCDIKY